MRVKLAPAEWLALAIAVVGAQAFLVHEWLYPSTHDAVAYARIGREIADYGLFRRFERAEVTTYGYPFVLSFVHRAAVWLGLPFNVVLCQLQLGAYLLATFYLRHALARLGARAARIAFCGLLVNYYVLIYFSASLTESASLSLLVFAAACWIDARGNAMRHWPLIAGSLAIGFAVMVRPGNLYMIPVWLLGCALVAFRERLPPPRAIVLGTGLVGALLLPMLPQVVNNHSYFETWSPLPVTDLGGMQQRWGISMLKYATGRPPIPKARIVYNNPFAEGTTVDEASPLRWYVDYPGRGLATLALHVFNLTDQDLLFTYSRDPDPWYRLPLGVVNHAVVALGLGGLFLLGRRVWASREAVAIDGYVVLLALLCANLGVYAWTAVEMRFGLVLLLVLFPLAGYGLLRVAGTRDLRVAGAVGLGVAAYVVLALVLSGWVRDQAPLLR